MSLLKKLKIWFKGWNGELTVKLMNWWYLDKKIYHTINNVYLPTFGRGITQIDHIIVSIYGIFVVETKNYNGWIQGNQYEKNWTQTFPSIKFPFQNPLHQNYGHIKNVSEILKIPVNKFHSIVMFIGENCEFKTEMPNNVLLKGYIKYIKSKTEKILTEKEVTNTIEGIKTYRKPNNSKTKREHYEYIKNTYTKP